MKKTLFILLLLHSFGAGAQGGKQISLEDIWRDQTFAVKTVPGFNAMQDGMHYTRIDTDSSLQRIRIYDLEKGKPGRTVFDNSRHSYKGTRLSISSYAFSIDETKLLLFTERQQVYRRSALYKVYVFHTADGTTELLDTAHVLHASFSPDGSKVAFVRDNNLFYRDLKTHNTIAVSHDGAHNEIINGNCDWVYEEEFEFTKAFEWSPDSRHLAFYRFDETEVPLFGMDLYQGIYPARHTFKYPKAGEPNSVVSIRLFNLNSGRTLAADIGSETDQYIPRIKWTGDPEKLCIFRMNRLQNRLELLLTHVSDGSAEVIYTEENPYYIEISDALHFLPDNRSFIFTSERDGFNHLYRWDWTRSKLTRITSGKYDVDKVIGVDPVRKRVYYTAADPSPLQRRLYEADWNGKNRKTLTAAPGTHDILPVKGFRYFLDKHSTLTGPPVYRLLDARGNAVRTLEDNSALKEKMQEYTWGNISLTTLPGDSGIMLNAWIITPPGFDSTRRYPVLMYQYSGPGSQLVADRFPAGDFFWHQMLASHGYIIVCADGTGTGFRGQEFRKKTYLQLGKYESDDQIALARYLGSLPYVNKDRIGIWGWSYGGFMSSTCLLKGNDVFKMAIAVAPVTNWRYYDNIYTERYMRKPQDNPGGYDANAPEQMASDLRGKFLLIHGTADDNVHHQNALMLMNELIRHNKQFDSEFYPDRAHGIGGGNARLHLYRRMTDFILEHL